MSDLTASCTCKHDGTPTAPKGEELLLCDVISKNDDDEEISTLDNKVSHLRASSFRKIKHDEEPTGTKEELFAMVTKEDYDKGHVVFEEEDDNTTRDDERAALFWGFKVPGEKNENECENQIISADSINSLMQVTDRQAGGTCQSLENGSVGIDSIGPPASTVEEDDYATTYSAARSKLEALKGLKEELLTQAKIKENEKSDGTSDPPAFKVEEEDHATLYSIAQSNATVLKEELLTLAEGEENEDFVDQSLGRKIYKSIKQKANTSAEKTRAPGAKTKRKDGQAKTKFMEVAAKVKSRRGAVLAKSQVVKDLQLPLSTVGQAQEKDELLVTYLQLQQALVRFDQAQVDKDDLDDDNGTTRIHSEYSTVSSNRSLKYILKTSQTGLKSIFKKSKYLEASDDSTQDSTVHSDTSEGSISDSINDAVQFMINCIVGVGDNSMIENSRKKLDRGTEMEFECPRSWLCLGGDFINESYTTLSDICSWLVDPEESKPTLLRPRSIQSDNSLVGEVDTPSVPGELFEC